MLSKIVPGIDSTDVVLIRPMRARARVYAMGTVIVSTARVRIEGGKAYVLGEILHETTDHELPTSKVRGRLREYNVDEGEITAAGAYIVGDTIYVSKDV